MAKHHFTSLLIAMHSNERNDPRQSTQMTSLSLSSVTQQNIKNAPARLQVLQALTPRVVLETHKNIVSEQQIRSPASHACTRMARGFETFKNIVSTQRIPPLASHACASIVRGSQDAQKYCTHTANRFTRNSSMYLYRGCSLRISSGSCDFSSIVFCHSSNTSSSLLIPSGSRSI